MTRDTYHFAQADRVEIATDNLIGELIRDDYNGRVGIVRSLDINYEEVCLVVEGLEGGHHVCLDSHEIILPSGKVWTYSDPKIE